MFPLPLVLVAVYVCVLCLELCRNLTLSSTVYMSRSHKQRGSYHAPYVVDFSASVLERTRLLRIDRSVFERLVSGAELTAPGFGVMNTSPSLLARQPSSGVLKAEEAGMLAREMSSPRARSLSGRLAAQNLEQTSDVSPAAVVPALALSKAQGSMTQAVTAGRTAASRLQAATQLRNLNRSHRSASEANLSALAGGKRSPSPEVLMAARRGESLVPPATPGEVAKSGRRASNGSKLQRIQSDNCLEAPELDLESGPEPEPEPEKQQSVTFAKEEQPDEEEGTARP